MAGVTIQVDFDAASVDGELADVLLRLDDTLPLMDAIGAVLVEGTVRRFEAGVSPEGVPWPKSLRAELGLGPTMIETGRLMNSITHLPEIDEVQVGTNVLYGRIHQLGGEIRPQTANALVFTLPNGATVTVGKVTIPPRPYLGVDAEDAAEIEDQARIFLEGMIQ